MSVGGNKKTNKKYIFFFLFPLPDLVLVHDHHVLRDNRDQQPDVVPLP